MAQLILIGFFLFSSLSQAVVITPPHVPACDALLLPYQVKNSELRPPALAKGKYELEFEGQSLELESVPEWEHRISWRGQDSYVQNIAARLIRNFYPEQAKSLRQRTMGQVQLFEEPWTGRVFLAPLASEFEEFHEPIEQFHGVGQIHSRRRQRQWRIDEVVIDDPANRRIPNEKLMGETFNVLPSRQLLEIGARERDRDAFVSRNVIETKYFVGWRRETAIYFDVSDELWAKNGWAVRLKLKMPKDVTLPADQALPNPESLARVVHMALTIKQDLGTHDSFGVRQEYNIELPLDFDLNRVAALSRLVMSLLAPYQMTKDFPVQPRWRVDTNRIGVNLFSQPDVNGEKAKIGFLTIDEFSRYRRGKFGHWLSEGVGMQSEMEILPEFQDRVGNDEELRREIEKFRQEIVSRFSGEVDPHPKYLTPMLKNRVLP